MNAPGNPLECMQVGKNIQFGPMFPQDIHSVLKRARWVVVVLLEVKRTDAWTILLESCPVPWAWDFTKFLNRDDFERQSSGDNFG
jgi:hypothetical protein